MTDSNTENATVHGIEDALQSTVDANQAAANDVQAALDEAVIKTAVIKNAAPFAEGVMSPLEAHYRAFEASVEKWKADMLNEHDRLRAEVAADRDAFVTFKDSITTSKDFVLTYADTLADRITKLESDGVKKATGFIAHVKSLFRGSK